MYSMSYWGCVITLSSSFRAVFNLANEIDVEQTKKKVESYRKDNQTVIMKNRDRTVRTVAISESEV